MAGDGSHPDRLRTAEAPYPTPLDGQPEMVCRFRIDGTIVFVNGAYARARGSSPETMVGRNFWDFIAEADRASVRAMLQRLTPEMPEISLSRYFNVTSAPLQPLRSVVICQTTLATSVKSRDPAP